MAGATGRLRRIADAVGEAVQAVAAGAGLAAGPTILLPSDPQPKATRKAGRKAAVARAERAEQTAKDARLAAGRQRAAR